MQRSREGRSQTPPQPGARIQARRWPIIPSAHVPLSTPSRGISNPLSAIRNPRNPLKTNADKISNRELWPPFAALKYFPAPPRTCCSNVKMSP